MLLTRFRAIFVILAVGSIYTFYIFVTRFPNAISSTVSKLPFKNNDQPPPYKPKYKPDPPYVLPPVVDNFPLAAAAHSADDLPPIPSWNTPPEKHIEEVTPLFIGFTRNWRMLQQAVVSYVTSGWPPSDIYVIENTGVMDSNAKGRLSLQNPFFMNYTRLEMLGVNVIRTPTLLNFAQLQNFYLNMAIEKEWPHFFWSHMDMVAISFEPPFATDHPDRVYPGLDHSDFKTIYSNCVDRLREAKALQPPNDLWSMRFFRYDHLSLVNVRAWVSVGGWDTMIPYYATDCDMHDRLNMDGWRIKDEFAGMLMDVGSSLDDLIVLYRKNGTVKASFTDPYDIEEKLEAESKKKAEEKKAGEKKKRRGLNYKRDIPESTEEIVENVVELEKRAPPDTTSVTHTLLGRKASDWADDVIGSEDFHTLERIVHDMEIVKARWKGGRNTWQTRQKGGEGEPFYRDPSGFETALQMTIEHGRNVFNEKWGHRGCGLFDLGLKSSDAWRVEHDW